MPAAVAALPVAAGPHPSASPTPHTLVSLPCLCIHHPPGQEYLGCYPRANPRSPSSDWGSGFDATTVDSLPACRQLAAAGGFSYYASSLDCLGRRSCVVGNADFRAFGALPPERCSCSAAAENFSLFRIAPPAADECGKPGACADGGATTACRNGADGHTCGCVAAFGVVDGNHPAFHPCAACPAGAGAPAGGASTCRFCGVNEKATEDQSACVCVVTGPGYSELACNECKPGYGGAACQACTGTTYAPGGSLAACLQAPLRAVVNGGRSAYTCVTGAEGTLCDRCRPGYGGATCQACTANTYSPGGSLDPCIQAPDRTVVNAGRTGVVCVDGAQGSGCYECRPGYGGQLCQACAGNTYSAGGAFVSCVAPPPRTVVNTDRSGFVCVPGAGGDSCDQCKPGYGGQGCLACTGNLYSPGGALADCLQAPARMVATADRSNVVCVQGAQGSSCETCKPGYGGQECQACSSNTYSPGGGLGACLPPPPRSEVNPERTGVVCVRGAQGSNCDRCKPGFGGQDCLACTGNFYSPGGSLVDCLQAPARMVPTADRSNVVCVQGAQGSSCETCMPGYGGQDCSPCAGNSYSPGGSLAACMPPPLRTMVAANRSSVVCVEGAQGSGCNQCKPGYGGIHCLPCAGGKYSTGGSLADCLTCGASNSRSNDGVTCTCAAGAEGPSCNVCLAGYGGSKCAACTGTTVSEGGQGATCKACPARTVPSPGREYCACAPSTQGGACDACKAGFGGTKCLACTGNTVSEGGVGVTCKACPVRTVPSPGREYCACAPSTQGGACDACAPGFGGTECTACTGNTVSEGGVGATCTKCPVRTVPGPGREYCACAPSTLGGACDACAPGFGGTECLACKGNAVSAGGSLAKCAKCPPGMPPNSNRTACGEKRRAARG
jgi:hypothetical protein